MALWRLARSSCRLYLPSKLSTTNMTDTCMVGKEVVGALGLGVPDAVDVLTELVVYHTCLGKPIHVLT